MDIFGKNLIIRHNMRLWHPFVYLWKDRQIPGLQVIITGYPSGSLNATFPYLLTSGALQQVVAEDLGVAVVPAQISASVVGDTNIFQIRTVAGDAQTAYEVLQSVIKNYPEVAKYVVGDTKLQLLDEGGISSEPLNLPQYELRMLQGAVIASMVAALLVLFRTAACKTIKTAGELKSFLQTPCLAELPQVRLFHWGGLQMQESPHRLEDWPISYREALDTLQIRLLQILGKKQWKLFMVTSTLAGEGKTTTACNLALTLARKGYEVLLVDGDLRHPSVASALHLKEGKTGFCDVLHQRELVAEAIVTMEGNGLHVLPGRMPVFGTVRSVHTTGTGGTALRTSSDGRLCDHRRTTLWHIK